MDDNPYQKLYYADEYDRWEYAGMCNECKTGIFLGWNDIYVGDGIIKYHIGCVPRGV